MQETLGYMLKNMLFVKIMFADNVRQYHVLHPSSMLLYVTKNNLLYEMNLLHTKTKKNHSICSSTEKPNCELYNAQNNRVFSCSGVCHSDKLIMFVARNDLDSALIVCRYDDADGTVNTEHHKMRGKISGTFTRVSDNLVILTLESAVLSARNDAVETNIKSSTLILYDIKKRQEIQRFENSVIKLVDDTHIMLVNLHYYVLYKLESLEQNISLLQVPTCFAEINEYYRKCPKTLGTVARTFCHTVVNCIVSDNFAVLTLPFCDGDILEAKTTIFELQ